MKYELLIEKAKAAGFEALEIYANHNYGLQIAVFAGEVDQNKISDSYSYTVRGIYQNKMAVFTTEYGNEEPDYIVARLKENAATLTTTEEFEIYKGSPAYPDGREPNPVFAQIPVSEKIALLKGLENKVKAFDARIIHVPYCMYNENLSTVEIINSYGLKLKKENGLAHITVQAVAKEGEQTQTSYKIDIKLDYNEFDPDAIAREVGEKVIAKLNASPVPSKSYPIIFENEAMSDLLASFVSMFSGESAVKRITPLLGKEGEKVFSEKITFIDDPLYPGAPNFQPFDDEGVASYKKKIVDKGVFTTFLHNLKTAKYFKTQSTGNGFKMGSDINVDVTNFLLTSDEAKKSKEEIIKGVKEGLLITELAGLHAGVNPVNGDFSAQASGFLIENGAIARPVNLIVVSGNFLKMMNAIEEIGTDFELFYTNIGTPSVKVSQLPVSGL
ncbi:MAG TPA: TldD/PmbA family protein [Acholeplasmataceae bacterium]|jgi:PmbA protein|nr:TldD/PmbA family protein [Acholeplasmataceae bacterium]